MKNLACLMLSPEVLTTTLSVFKSLFFHCNSIDIYADVMEMQMSSPPFRNLCYWSGLQSSPPGLGSQAWLAHNYLGSHPAPQVAVSLLRPLSSSPLAHPACQGPLAYINKYLMKGNHQQSLQRFFTLSNSATHSLLFCLAGPMFPARILAQTCAVNNVQK